MQKKTSSGKWEFMLKRKAREKIISDGSAIKRKAKRENFITMRDGKNRITKKEFYLYSDGIKLSLSHYNCVFA